MSNRRSRHGFTLTEILIVIGLILLVVTLAVASFSTITGGRSVDAAQNQISAALARARQDAMGLQEPRGIVFFPDANTGRTVAAEVYLKNWSDRSPLLELLPDREEMELSVGVGCQVFPHYRGGGVAPFPLIGVVMFDGLGRMMVQPWYVPKDVVTNQSAPNYNALRVRLDPLPVQIVPGTANADPPLGGPNPPPPPPAIPGADSPIPSQIGVLLYDKAGFEDANDKTRFLADNAATVLINRYNGTLLPSR